MNITVYCGSHTGAGEKYMQAAKDLGTWIGESGNTLVYGGSSVGLMGAVSLATMNAGGCVIGVEPRFFLDAGVAQHDLTELHVVETMAARKAKMIELGEAFVAMPGGIGTLEEISEIMSRIRLNITPAPCYLLNLDGFYDPMADFIHEMVDAGFLPGYEGTEFLFPKSVEELTQLLAKFDPRTCEYSSESDWQEPRWMDGQIG